MGGTEVYVARATSFEQPSAAHALGIAGLAASQQRPILLSNVADCHARPRDVLRRHGHRQRHPVRWHAPALAQASARAVDRRVDVVDRVDPGPAATASPPRPAKLALQGIQDETQLWIANGARLRGRRCRRGGRGAQGRHLLMVHKGNLDWSPAARRYLRSYQANLAP